jgi:hypothetical protein
VARAGRHKCPTTGGNKKEDGADLWQPRPHLKCLLKRLLVFVPLRFDPLAVLMLGHLLATFLLDGAHSILLVTVLKLSQPLILTATHGPLSERLEGKGVIIG